MLIELAYGRDGLSVDLPDSIDILTPRFTPGIPDVPDALRYALRNPIDSAPLSELVKPGDSVVIVHSDITRATPNKTIIPAILEELKLANIPDQNIKFINGLGTHRHQTDSEMRELLGDHIMENYQCIQHDCRDINNLETIGVSKYGYPIQINRKYMESDVRILTGFIEPHFFAGFSGGPKAVLPALAGIDTIYHNHGPKLISHPKSTWGITAGNPIWEEMRNAAVKTNPTFLLNVTLNSRKEITGIFAGDVISAHGKGASFVKEHAMVEVDYPYDIVITTNSGYPLDQNLYQSIKGISAANQIVKNGGAILIATACEEGMPDHGCYASMLENLDTPKQALDMISKSDDPLQDQWQVQIQALIQMRSDVFVYSDGVSKEQIKKAMLIPCEKIVQTVTQLIKRYGPNTRICVMPEGPQTIPYLRKG